MATIKSFTDLEQSKKLAEILSLESADMCYIKHSSSDNPTWEFNEDFPPMILGDVPINEITAETLPCWSLAALLGVLPIVNLCAVTLKMKLNHKYYMDLCTNIVNYRYISTNDYDNPVDACVEMIIKLKELNLL